MFVGSINADLRSLVAELALKWKGRPCYIACSGNQTVERILHSVGVKELHGNDVSLYSCVLGSTLAGHPINVGLKDQSLNWMAPYLEPGLPTVATLLLAMEYLKFTGRSEAYHRRMAKAYEVRWPTMHAASVEKLTKMLEGMQLASFTAGDCVPFVQAVPDDAVVVTFPPTYEKGYERLYKAIDATFEWEAPTYETFTADSFKGLVETMQTKAHWLTMRDEPLDWLMPFSIGSFQTGARMKRVYAYAGEGRTRVSEVRQKTEPVPLPRLEGRVDGRLALVRLTAGQLNLLRSEYLAPGIIPSAAQINLGITVNGQLIGAMAFVRPTFLGGFCDAYVMTDLAIRPTVHKRLAKLVLAAMLSTEVKAILEQSLGNRVRVIGTTAFTKKPVSMKYRGLFDLYSRKEGALNYVAEAGRWSLADGMAWWQKHHGETA
jgi:hypothetical protein